MTKDPLELWERFKRRRSTHPEIGLALDLSRLNFADDYFESVAKPMQKAFVDMRELEEGAISNPDENRMVGHYWLRNSKLAPNKEIQKSIDVDLNNQHIKND